MSDLSSGFRDPEIARGLVDAIRETAQTPCTLMEVCGTHTMAIAKHGLRGLMPDTINLLSGPGCPVCVTANADIDLAIEIARQPGVADDSREEVETSMAAIEEAAEQYQVKIERQFGQYQTEASSYPFFARLGS